MVWDDTKDENGSLTSSEWNNMVAYVKTVIESASNVLASTVSADMVDYGRAVGLTSSLGNLGLTEELDWSSATHFTGTLDDDLTITHVNELSGQKITLILSYDSSQKTITWSDVDVWLDGIDGSSPLSPGGVGEVLVVTLLYVGTTCYGSATGNYSVYA